MTVDVGDLASPQLTVSPFDGTTAATCAVSHDGTAIAGSPFTGATADSGATWTITPYVLTAPGEWIETWTVTGKGRGVASLVRTVEAQPAAVQYPGSYASSAQFYGYTGAQGPRPDSLGLLLRRASRDVDRALITAVYSLTDYTRDSTEANPRTVADALAEATIEQACSRIAMGQEDGIAAGFHAMQIGSVNLTRGYTGAGSAAVNDTFSTAGWQILVNAGLTGRPPFTSAG